MRALLAVGICLSCAGSLTVCEVLADAPRVALRWNAPEQCPDDAQLIAAVESLLGEPLAQAPAQ